MVDLSTYAKDALSIPVEYRCALCDGLALLEMLCPACNQRTLCDLARLRALPSATRRTVAAVLFDAGAATLGRVVGRGGGNAAEVG